MGHAIPRQHPAVVLRSHFNLVRALLIAATVAVIGLSVAVVILANEDEDVRSATAAQPIDAARHLNGATPQAPQSDVVPQRRLDGATDRVDPLTGRGPGPAATRYDGGPEEGTRGLTSSPPAPGVRYDGGPEEGTRGQVTPQSASGSRYDGGPEEGSRGLGK